MTLDELGALCQAATPGPWYEDPRPNQPSTRIVSDLGYIAEFHHGADAAFIAACREAVPKLIEIARAAEYWIKAVDEHEQYSKDNFVAPYTYTIIAMANALRNARAASAAFEAKP